MKIKLHFLPPKQNSKSCLLKVPSEYWKKLWGGEDIGGPKHIFLDFRPPVTSPMISFRFSEGTFSKQLFELTKFHKSIFQKNVLGVKNAI